MLHYNRKITSLTAQLLITFPRIELPVRHNEDLINIELSKNLPLKAERFGVPMWDPHVKAYLLIQAFMSRIDLPISDYVTDQNSVLDQSIRIIQVLLCPRYQIPHSG